MEDTVAQISRWAGIIRDLGVILGVPFIIGLLVRYYHRQIEILREHNKLLERTQYKGALEQIEAQEKLFARDRLALEQQLSLLDQTGGDKEIELEQTKERLQKVEGVLRNLRSAIHILEEGAKHTSLITLHYGVKGTQSDIDNFARLLSDIGGVFEYTEDHGDTFSLIFKYPNTLPESVIFRLFEKSNLTRVGK
jgi:hypothetical protein